MRIFKSRTIKEYNSYIKKLLSLETAQKNALKISKPKIIEDKEYKYCIRIDFLGQVASTLFDVGGLRVKYNVFDELRKLADRTTELNSKGYFIKIRLLLEYPYSVSSYSRIQSESSSERSSVKEPIYNRGFKIVEQVDQSIFGSSSFISTQSNILSIIQSFADELQEKHNWNERDSPNSIRVRFTPISPGMCCLFINNKLFFDVYLYAKETRYHTTSILCSPVVEISFKEKYTFKAYEDHFRYLWDLDVTLDCQDATKYAKNRPRSLSKIIPPQQIDYESKAKKILENDSKLTTSEAIKWKNSARRILNRYTADLSPNPASESIFVTCSWTKGEDGTSAPNKYAEYLAATLQKDFTTSMNTPLISVRIMQAVPAEFLSAQLYINLEDSTLAIILLTKDIQSTDGNYYSKPNVYHELGYLMKHLGRDKITILSEKGVIIPSNIQDIPRFEFETDKIELIYLDLIKQLENITYFDKYILESVSHSHTNRLFKCFKKGTIAKKEFEYAKNRIQRWSTTLVSTPRRNMLNFFPSFQNSVSSNMSG